MAGLLEHDPREVVEKVKSRLMIGRALTTVLLLVPTGPFGCSSDSEPGPVTVTAPTRVPSPPATTNDEASRACTERVAAMSRRWSTVVAPATLSEVFAVPPTGFEPPASRAPRLAEVAGVSLGIGAVVTLEDRVVSGDDATIAASLAEQLRPGERASGVGPPPVYVFASGDVLMERVQLIVSGLVGRDIRLAVRPLEGPSPTPIPPSLARFLLPRRYDASGVQEQVGAAMRYAFGSCAAAGRALKGVSGTDLANSVRHAVTGGLIECDCQGADLDAIEYLFSNEPPMRLHWIPLPRSGPPGTTVATAAIGS